MWDQLPTKSGRPNWLPICEMFSQRNGGATLALNKTKRRSTPSFRGTRNLTNRSAYRMGNMQSGHAKSLHICEIFLRQPADQHGEFCYFHAVMLTTGEILQLSLLVVSTTCNKRKAKLLLICEMFDCIQQDETQTYAVHAAPQPSSLNCPSSLSKPPIISSNFCSSFWMYFFKK